MKIYPIYHKDPEVPEFEGCLNAEAELDVGATPDGFAAHIRRLLASGKLVLSPGVWFAQGTKGGTGMVFTITEGEGEAGFKQGWDVPPGRVNRWPPKP